MINSGFKKYLACQGSIEYVTQDREVKQSHFSVPNPLKALLNETDVTIQTKSFAED